MKIRSVILLATTAYLLTLLVRFPAELVFANITTAPLVIDKPGGTLWSGKAKSISLGPNRLEDVEWTVDLTSLLEGRVGAEIEFKALGGNGQARVARAFNGDVFITDGEFQIASQALESLLSVSLVQIGGPMQVLVEEAHFTPQQFQSVRGNLTWRKALLNSPAQANLGTVTVTVVPSPDGHTAELENEGGVLRISGKLDVDKLGGYRADIRLKPQANAPEELLSMLKLLGRSGSGGNYRFRQSGKLQNFL
jgi:hypothetical protein